MPAQRIVSRRYRSTRQKQDQVSSRQPDHTGRRGKFDYGVAAAFFALLACLMLYWPLMHATTHVPGAEMTDYFHFHWSYWWTGHALTTPGLSVFETNYVMFPFTTNLAYHTYSPFWYPLWALLEPLIGTLATVQVIFVTALTLTGLMMYALLRVEDVPPLLALAGACVLQLSSAMYSAVLMTTIHYLGFFWLPAQILIWRQVIKASGESPNAHWYRRTPVLVIVQGLALYLMLMTDYQYGLYSVFLLGPYVLLGLIQADWRSRIRQFGIGVAAIMVLLAAMWFAGPLPYLLSFDTGTLAPGAPDQAYAIAFPDGYFWRTGNHRNDLALGAIAVPVTLLTLLLSVTALRRYASVMNNRRWFWLAISIPPLLLSAGATVTLLGVEIPMPYRLVHEALGGLFRSVHRFGIVFIIPAMIFVGQTWGPLLKRRLRAQPILAALFIFVVFLDGRLFNPIPIQPVMPAYAFYDMMGAEQGAPYDDYAIVEIPTGAGTGEYFVGQQYRDLATQFYGMTHGKRMVNGLLARAPVEHYYYLRTDDPMLSWLGQRRPLEPDAVREQLRERVFNWPVGYIIVHQDFIGRTESATQEIIGYLNMQTDLLCPLLVEKDAIVYRTRWHPDGCPPRVPPQIEPGHYVIDIGAPEDVLFLGWGWYYAESVAGLDVRWTGDWVDLVYGIESWLPGPYHQADLILDLPPGEYHLTLTLQSLDTDRLLTVFVNDYPLGTQPVDHATLQDYTFHIPADVVADGQHLNIRLGYDEVSSTEQRHIGLMVDRVVLTRLAEGDDLE